MSYPRPLAENEAAILDKLLRDESFPGAAAFRSQVPYLTVTGGCSCGCATVDLSVDHSAPVQQGAAISPLPVEGWAKDPANPELRVELLVFTDGGYLTMLEIVSYGEQPPQQFPPCDAIEVVTLKR
jgi:hypothetical protein